MQPQIVKAFLAGRKRRLGHARRMEPGGGVGDRGIRYETDGKTLWVWGNEVARRVRNAVYITDAGWMTLLTRNVLNEVLEQVGASTRIYSDRRKWKLWDYQTHQKVDWPGRAVIKGGKVRLLSASERHSTVYEYGPRRGRTIYIPPPPEPPKPRMLFNRGAMQGDIVKAFLSGRSRRMGTSQQYNGYRYKTDGKTIWVWGNEVAKKVPGGVMITDAGWHTQLTKNTLNEVMSRTGAGGYRIFSHRGEWVLGTVTREWTGYALIRPDGTVMPLSQSQYRSGIAVGKVTRSGERFLFNRAR
jgi:hypothetical protein